MLPTFPEFKGIAAADRKAVELFTLKFPPYSDYDFTSLLSWDTSGNMGLSTLNNNLVILFYDYVTEQPYLSFIGSNKLEETALSLIAYSKSKFQVSELRLIPKCVATMLPAERIAIQSDLAAYDYILSAELLSKLHTLSNQNVAAYWYKKFLALYPLHTVSVTKIVDGPTSACLALFRKWAELRNIQFDSLKEYKAFERYMLYKENAGRIVSVYDDAKLIGFMTYEVVSDRYAVAHFSKADSMYKGINGALTVFVSNDLLKQNVPYWNFEQDLGLPELRQAKRKYMPDHYLEKYIVALH